MCVPHRSMVPRMLWEGHDVDSTVAARLDAQILCKFINVYFIRGTSV